MAEQEQTGVGDQSQLTIDRLLVCILVAMIISVFAGIIIPEVLIHNNKLSQDQIEYPQKVWILTNLSIIGGLFFVLLLRNAAPSASLFLAIAFLGMFFASPDLVIKVIGVVRGREDPGASENPKKVEPDYSLVRVVGNRGARPGVPALYSNLVSRSAKGLRNPNRDVEFQNLMSDARVSVEKEGDPIGVIFADLKSRLEAKDISLPSTTIAVAQEQIALVHYESLASSVIEEQASYPLQEIVSGGSRLNDLLSKYGNESYFQNDMSYLEEEGLIQSERSDYSDAVATDLGRVVAAILSGDPDDETLLRSIENPLESIFDIGQISGIRQSTFQVVELDAEAAHPQQDYGLFQHNYVIEIPNVDDYSVRVKGGTDLAMAIYRIPPGDIDPSDLELIATNDDFDFGLEPGFDLRLGRSSYLILVRELGVSAIEVPYTIEVFKGSRELDRGPFAQQLDSKLMKAALQVDINPTGSSRNTVGRQETHYFRIYVDNPGDYVVETTSESDLVLALYSGSGIDLIAYDDDGGENFDPKIEIELERGAYFIALKDLDNKFVNPNYSLVVRKVED